MHLPPYKSETKLLTPGSPVEYFDFVPPIGPGGGRNIIDKFILVITGVITVAVATWNGKDVPRIAQLITVEKRDGRLRWNLSGYKSRIASIRYNGIEEHQEHGTVAIAAGQAIDLRLIIPMKKKKLRRGKDYALPADAFKKVTIAWAALATAGAGATLSANTLNAYILAETHEENKVEMKVDDLVKSVDFNSNTQAKLSCQGVVHDLDVVLENATAGGAVVTAITDARIEDLGLPTLTFNDLKHVYTSRREIAPSGPTTPATERFLDPVREGLCLPIIVADDDTSPWDGALRDTLKVDVGTGAAGLSLISREVVPKSQADYQATVQRFNLNPDTDIAFQGVEGPKPLREPKTPREARKHAVGTWVAPLKSRAA